MVTSYTLTSKRKPSGEFSEFVDDPSPSPCSLAPSRDIACQSVVNRRWLGLVDISSNHLLSFPFSDEAVSDVLTNGILFSNWRYGECKKKKNADRMGFAIVMGREQRKRRYTVALMIQPAIPSLSWWHRWFNTFSRGIFPWKLADWTITCQSTSLLGRRI